MKARLDRILHGSVQKKILLLVFISVLPSLAVIVNSGIERLDNSLLRSKAEAFGLAEKAADVQKGVTEAMRILLTTLADLPVAVREDPVVMAGILKKMLHQNPDIANVFLINAQGDIMASGEPMPSLESRIPPFASEMLRPNGFRAGEFMICSVTFEPAIPFAYPLHADDLFSGMAVAVVKLDRFRDFTTPFMLPEGSILKIADRQGKVLFSSAASGPQAAESQLDESSMALFAGKADRGVNIVDNAGESGSILGFIRLRLGADSEPYALILASIPTDKAMSHARNILWRDIYLVLGATILALFTALVAGRIIITGKLKRLIATARQVEAGSLDARSGLDYRDGELGRLARSFDSMAHTLTEDISRREQAEMALKASRDFLEKIINSIADPIFVKDSEHRFVMVNQALAALAGLTPMDFVGRTDYDFFPTEEVDFFLQRDKLVLETGEEDESEEVISDAAGLPRVIVTKKTRYTDRNGNHHVVGVIRDVTEAKRSGMELINRTIQLNAQVKMLDCLYGISHLAQKRDVTLDRLLTEAVTILPPMLTYGDATMARIVYEGVQYPLTGFTSPAASITADILVRGKCKGFVETGYLEPKPAQEEGPFTREEAKILQVVAEHLGQIAERALAEEEVKQSEERFRRIVETANEGIAVLDPTHRITYVNSVMAEMLGYEHDEIIGQHIGMFLYEPSRTDLDDNARRRIPLSGKRERLFLRKNGTILCTIASVTPVTDREGHYAGSFGMYADISDRKMAEVKLQELNESLERLVRDRTADLSSKTADLEIKARQLEEANLELTHTAEKLNRARKHAVEATKAKSIFLANMSHEVRTPINAILGLSDLALRKGASGEVKHFLEMILKSSRGLFSLVNDILDFSKLEAGKAEAEAISFDLPRLVHDTLGAFAHQAEAKGLYLDTVIDSDLPMVVQSDPTKIRAILANLCSNAVKFTPEGGVKVQVSFAHRLTTFVVEDTGIGIPDDKRSFIFKSFRQVDETVGRKYGGTGLGLSISRKFAKLLGGTLTHSAREGGGSRFILTLPLNIGASHENAHGWHHAELKHAEKLTPKRILLAEDHEMGRELLTSFLRGFGHEVVCAEDGEQALEKLREGDFDLVLMDGRMPVMDGLQATRAIRSGACGPSKAGVPIVAITAQALKGDREAFLNAGMDDYVTKPVDLDEVLLVLARHASPKNRQDAVKFPFGEATRDVSETTGDTLATGSAAPDDFAPPPVPAGPERLPGQGAADGAPAGAAPLLDRESALARLKGMVALLDAMEATFLRATPEDFAELARAAEAGDLPGVRLYAHRVKGNAAGVGALRLSQAAQAMESASVSGIVPGKMERDELEHLFALTSEEMLHAKNTAGAGQ